MGRGLIKSDETVNETILKDTFQADFKSIIYSFTEPDTPR